MCTDVMLILLLMAPVMVYSCGEEVPHLPPCHIPKYEEVECELPGINGTTQIQIQCAKAIPPSIYERWQFWLGVVIVVVFICVCIAGWKFSRDCDWYKNLKNSMRHEKNRTCARWCITKCCTCACCVKCCEPYTRSTQSELQAAHDGLSVGTFTALPHHHSHHHSHHHHLHLDRRRSECVHPADVVEHEAHTPTVHHETHPNFQGKSLEQVCVDGVNFA